MTQNQCCRTMVAGESPFDILELGYLDGLTGGMARCRACGATYDFQMVAWDQEQEVRVYGFRPIRAEHYDRMVALSAEIAGWRPGERDYRKGSDALTLRRRDALSSSYEVTLLVASTDLCKRITAVRRMEFATWKETLREAP
jgi:hypothetical protein